MIKTSLYGGTSAFCGGRGSLATTGATSPTNNTGQDKLANHLIPMAAMVSSQMAPAALVAPQWGAMPAAAAAVAQVD